MVSFNDYISFGRVQVYFILFCLLGLTVQDHAVITRIQGQYPCSLPHVPRHQSSLSRSIKLCMVKKPMRCRSTWQFSTWRITEGDELASPHWYLGGVKGWISKHNRGQLYIELGCMIKQMKIHSQVIYKRKNE